ncbi:Type 1 glutamine amidotransferase-like domain-containing protein [Paenibacillus sp.]
MTKLVLLSDLVFESNDKLDQRIRSLFDSEQPSIGYIPSCSDPERKYFEHTRRYYNRLGIHTMQYYDLDMEYEESTFGSIVECDAIHLSGGNTFYFLSLLQKRNALGLLRSYLKTGGILIGVSAGSILTTPTIEIAGYGEDADENEVGLNDMKALGLVEFEFVPHWDGSEDTLNSLREYTRINRTAVYACQDGGGIVIDGESVELYGNVHLVDYKESGSIDE